MKPPIYTPKDKIETGLYTKGKEYMTLENKEYIGVYHRYPNGAVYSESTLNDFSIELQEYSSATEQEKTGTYFELTGTRFNNYISPKYYFPNLTDDDYKKANFKRYFVQRKNNITEIIEINKDSFKSVNSANDVGIDAGLYNKVSIKWSISGPIESVRAANQRVIINSSMPELIEYLTDLTEFYKY